MPAPSHRELFTGLLRELRAAGPLGRLRLLGRGVGALRQLSPWDRKMLLRMAGFEGAEELIERLASENPETAEDLQRIVAAVERDPDKAQDAVRALADPKRRGEAIDSLLRALDRAAEEDAEDEDAEDAEEPAKAGEAPVPTPAAPAPRAARASAPFPELASTPEGRSAGRAAAVTAGAAAGAAVAARRPTAPKPPPAPAPAPKTTTPSPPPAAAPAPVREPVRPAAPAATAPAPKAPEPPVRSPAAPTLATLSDLPSRPIVTRSGHDLMTALLDLRARLDTDETVTTDEMRRLLDETITPPWARRRAVSAWIEADGSGALASAEEALSLIAELGSPGDKTWCLASLAGSRRWPRAAWKKILAAAPDPAARRRIERRRTI